MNTSLVFVYLEQGMDLIELQDMCVFVCTCSAVSGEIGSAVGK